MPIPAAMSGDKGGMLCDVDNINANIELPPTPPSSHSSRSVSPELFTEAPAGELQTTASKKKKKKKSKKTSKAKATSDCPKQPVHADEDRPSVLCISRNKHWRYISSYHVRDALVCTFIHLTHVSGTVAAITRRATRISPRDQPRPSNTFRF